MQGKIIKGIAGFYYVECDGNIYECKARGVFRNRSEKPLVGDFVEFIILEGQEGKGNIEKILPRTSKLIRPEVANVDQALIVFAAIDPAPDMHLLNRFLVNMEMMDIKSIICINKNDLKKEERIPEIYTKAGYKVICTSVKENEGIEEIREILSNRTTTVAGPSGVGKSSLINTVAGKKVMETGEISQKIKRGKNTTRHSELITIGKNSYILDTPGFASVDVPDMEKEDWDGVSRNLLSIFLHANLAVAHIEANRNAQLKRHSKKERFVKKDTTTMLLFSMKLMIVESGRKV